MFICVCVRACFEVNASGQDLICMHVTVCAQKARKLYRLLDGLSEGCSFMLYRSCNSEAKEILILQPIGDKLIIFFIFYFLIPLRHAML
jgi:hypothetical protein